MEEKEDPLKEEDYAVTQAIERWKKALSESMFAKTKKPKITITGDFLPLSDWKQVVRFNQPEGWPWDDVHIKSDEDIYNDKKIEDI
jgi:predicted P-loop ATPase/GTPase